MSPVNKARLEMTEFNTNRINTLMRPPPIGRGLIELELLCTGTSIPVGVFFYYNP